MAVPLREVKNTVVMPITMNDEHDQQRSATLMMHAGWFVVGGFNGYSNGTSGAGVSSNSL